MKIDYYVRSEDIAQVIKYTEENEQQVLTYIHPYESKAMPRNFTFGDYIIIRNNKVNFAFAKDFEVGPPFAVAVICSDGFDRH